MFLPFLFVYGTDISFEEHLQGSFQVAVNLFAIWEFLLAQAVFICAYAFLFIVLKKLFLTCSWAVRKGTSSREDLCCLCIAPEVSASLCGPSPLLKTWVAWTDQVIMQLGTQGFTGAYLSVALPYPHCVIPCCPCVSWADCLQSSS